MTYTFSALQVYHKYFLIVFNYHNTITNNKTDTADINYARSRCVTYTSYKYK